MQATTFAGFNLRLNFAAMKLFTLLLLSVSAIVLSTSLDARTRYIGRHAAAKHIDTLFYFEPLSTIDFLDDKPQPHLTDSLSAISRSLQKKLLQNNAEKLHNATPITISDTALQRRINHEFIYLIASGINGKLYEDADTTGTIDSFMDATHRRFALLLFNGGYVKSGRRIWDDKYNRGYRAAKFWGYGDYVPGPEGVTIFGLIYDALENKTYFFNRDTKYETHYLPLAYNHLELLLKTVFEGFFWSKPNQERF